MPLLLALGPVTLGGRFLLYLKGVKINLHRWAAEELCSPWLVIIAPLKLQTLPNPRAPTGVPPASAAQFLRLGLLIQKLLLSIYT